MIIETYYDNDFYEKRWFVEIVFVNPNDLDLAVTHLSIYLFNKGIPTKPQNWCCRPNERGVGWRITVEFKLTLDQLINLR